MRPITSYDAALAAGEPMSAYLNREAAHVQDLADSVDAIADRVTAQNLSLLALHAKAQQHGLQESQESQEAQEAQHQQASHPSHPFTCREASCCEHASLS